VVPLAAPRAIDDSPLDIAKVLVDFGLSQIPVVGNILSLLLNLFWPSSPTPSVWDQVRAEVEKMIDGKINDAVFSLFKGKLNGLGGAMTEFLNAVRGGSGGNILSHYVSVKVQFATNIPEFQNPDYEWLLAPLYALMTQMHMSLLRDGKLHGESWGMDESTHAQAVEDFDTWGSSHDAYLGDVVARRREILQRSAPTAPGPHRTAIHNYWVPFEQHTTVLIDDYRLLIRAFRQPEAYQIPYRDVYSLAYGTADDWEAPAPGMAQNTGSVGGVYGRPQGDIYKIEMQFFNGGPRVVDVIYTEGNGPLLHGQNRVDRVGIIAPARAGVDPANVLFFNNFLPRRFHIRAASVRVGSIPLGLSLIKANGTLQWLWDRGSNPGGQTYEVAVEGRMLTTLNMWTHSAFYNHNLGCIIFGFSRDPIYMPMDIWRKIYVASIGEPKLGDLDGSDPTLKADREAFWRRIDTYKVGLCLIHQSMVTNTSLLLQPEPRASHE
jgi:hypothetical protein